MKISFFSISKRKEMMLKLKYDKYLDAFIIAKDIEGCSRKALRN
jgi:hypothetical protein